MSQQQYALPRSVNSSRNNIESATIQLLSLVFGSAAVVLLADLGLDGVDALGHGHRRFGGRCRGRL